MTGTPGGRATRFSTAAVVVATGAAVVALGLSVGQAGRVAVGAATALGLAGALHAAGLDRFRPVTAAAVGLVLPAVGFALVALAGATVVAQLRGSIPPGTVFMVLGATVATFGAATVTGPALDRSALVRALSVGLRVVGVVLLAVAAAALVQFAPVARALADVLAGAVGALVDPVPGEVQLGSALVLVAAAALWTWIAVRRLPVAALAGREHDAAFREHLGTVRRRALWVAAGTGLVGALALVAELLGAPYLGLPGPIRGLAAAVTGVPVLRWLLALVVVAAAAAVALAGAVRRGYRASGAELLASLSPYAAGVALVWVTLDDADDSVRSLIFDIERRLPEELAPAFEEAAPTVVDFYGPGLVALSVLGAALVTAFVIVAVTFLVIVSGLVPRTATGAAVASTGVFATAAFAVTTGAGLPVALAGVLASVLVWDAGEFGATLGRELGARAATARTELVHAGGTVLVGCCSLVAALAALGVVRGLDTGRVPVVPAVAAALVGAVFLAVASR